MTEESCNSVARASVPEEKSDIPEETHRYPLLSVFTGYFISGVFEPLRSVTKISFFSSLWPQTTCLLPTLKKYLQPLSVLSLLDGWSWLNPSPNTLRSHALILPSHSHWNTGVSGWRPVSFAAGLGPRTLIPVCLAFEAKKYNYLHDIPLFLVYPFF